MNHTHYHDYHSQLGNMQASWLKFAVIKLSGGRKMAMELSVDSLAHRRIPCDGVKFLG